MYFFFPNMEHFFEIKKSKDIMKHVTSTYLCIIEKALLLAHVCFFNKNLFYRSSHPEVLCKKGALRNFAKFIGKHVYQNLFFNKVAGLSPKACSFIKKEPLALAFSCKFCKISKNTSGGCFCPKLY